MEVSRRRDLGLLQVHRRLAASLGCWTSDNLLAVGRSVDRRVGVTATGFLSRVALLGEALSVSTLLSIATKGDSFSITFPGFVARRSFLLPSDWELVLFATSLLIASAEGRLFSWIVFSIEDFVDCLFFLLWPDESVVGDFIGIVIRTWLVSLSQLLAEVGFCFEGDTSNTVSIE